MTSFVLLSGAAVLVACGLWFTGKVWGKHSRVQSVYSALVLVGIVAWFVMRGLNRDANASTRALAVFPLGERGVAVLREREVRTRFRNIDETSSSADFVTEWMLQTPGGAAIPLFQVDNFLGKRSWYFRGAHDRLWVSTGDSILLVSLVDGRVLHTPQTLGAAQSVFLPPFELHEHPFDRRSQRLVVRDREARWWKVGDDLRVEPTTSAAAEFEWRGDDDDLRRGCHSRREYYESSQERSRVRLTELKPPSYGPGPDQAPEGNVLNATLLRDTHQHCTVDTKDGAIVLHRKDLGETGALLLSLAANADGELRWTSPLAETCGTGRARPVRSHEQDGTLVLLFGGGVACAINSADGRRLWTTDLLSSNPPVSRTGAQVVEVAWSAAGFESWIALDSGALVHTTVTLPSGTVVSSTVIP